MVEPCCASLHSSSPLEVTALRLSLTWDVFLGRNCASCSVLLNPSSGYLHVNQKRTGPLQSMDPEGQADDQGPMLRIRLRLDALKFHDKKCSMQRRQRTSRRHTTTIRCNRAKTAMMEVPGQSTGLDTLVRRCWSVIPQVSKESGS